MRGSMSISAAQNDGNNKQMKSAKNHKLDVQWLLPENVG
jgi:hypothetical protein